MTDNTQPDSVRIITSSDILLHDAETALMYEELRAAIDDGHESMTHADALAEIAAIRAENAALQQGYDAARLEIEHLRGVTKSKLLAQPVAWMVYLPSIDTQHLYYSQEDMGYVDDVTNHADAEVTPLYEMAAPKAEVAPAGEYPAITAEFINKHVHPSQAAKLCRADWSGKDESSVETVHPEVIKLLHAYVDADRAMRAQADSQPALPEITDEDRSFLHYNPNTDDIVEWVHNYASAAIAADRGMRVQAAPVAQGDAEDAARYRFLAARCRITGEHWGGRWSIVVEGPAPESHDSKDDFDAAIDVARKQGANHD